MTPHSSARAPNGALEAADPALEKLDAGLRARLREIGPDDTTPVSLIVRHVREADTRDVARLLTEVGGSVREVLPKASLVSGSLAPARVLEFARSPLVERVRLELILRLA